MSISFSIVIVNFNTQDFLNRCLSSIYSHIKRNDVEIIVVDNASTDGSQAMVKSLYPYVHLIEHTDNLGFVAANNQAIKIAHGRFILLLNSDTTLTEDGVDELITFMENTPDAGIVGGKIFFPDKSIQYSCRRFHRFIWEFFNQTVVLIKDISPFTKKMQMADFDYNSIRQVDWVSGAYMLIRKEIIDRIGLFDPEIFMFFEDTDLCRRVRSAGYNVYFVPGSKIYHYHGMSAKKNLARSIVYSFKSSIVYFRKHHGMMITVWYRLSVITTWYAFSYTLRILNLILPLQKIKKKKELFKNLINEYTTIKNSLVTPYPVLHVLYSGKLAGAEEYTRTLVNNLNKKIYSTHVCFLHSGGAIAELIRQAGIPVTIIGMKHGFDVFGAFKFLSFVETRFFSLIHFHMPNMLSMWISLLTGNRVVYQEHNSIMESGLRRILFKQLFHKAKKIIAVSLFTKNRLIDNYNLQGKKVEVVYNGIDLNKFQINFEKGSFRNSLCIKKNIPIIGFVGRLSIREKGCDLLLDAIAKVKSSYGNFHLLVLGEGSLKTSLEQYARQLDLTDYVSFLGARSDIPYFFNIFDVFVLPSKMESFGLVLLEAMACKVPVVAFSVGGIPEIMENGTQGFLATPYDIDELAEKILILLKDKSLRKKLGHAGFIQAKNFQIQQNISHIERIYKEVIT